jgi:hypothetical protein
MDCKGRISNYLLSQHIKQVLYKCEGQIYPLLRHAVLHITEQNNNSNSDYKMVISSQKQRLLHNLTDCAA